LASALWRLPFRSGCVLKIAATMVTVQPLSRSGTDAEDANTMTTLYAVIA
jgi:hypothetical protein